jgi:pSer/pThr/pTyr-binding forkhead associated (FHA) protein
MAASLVPTKGGNPIVLDRPIMLIGRDSDCEFRLQTSSKVSRHHCFIVQCGEQYRLRDLGSTNGVRLNSKRVVEAELRPGDEVTIADISFTFGIAETVAQPAPGFQQRQRDPAPLEPATVRIAADDRDPIGVAGAS